MRTALGLTLAFLLGAVAATTLSARANPGGFTAEFTETPVRGYHYDPARSRIDIALDEYAPSCRGVPATVSISADRQTADLICGGQPAGKLPPTWSADELAVFWRRR